MENNIGRATWKDFTLRYCGATDQGMVRKVNEDNFLISTEFLLFCVADGMGGHAAGDFASRLTLECVQAFLAHSKDPAETPISAIPAAWMGMPLLTAAAHFANLRVHEAANGIMMGSTLVAARFAPERLEIVHAGDSRGYLWRQGSLRQLTKDHSLVEELFSRGRITEEEMHNHPQKNVVTQAIGPHAVVDPHFQEVELNRGDLLLLCSDGLSGMLRDSEISQELASGKDIDQMAANMIHRANQAGGRDNITVVMVGIE